MSVYRWKTFLDNEDRPEKPRRYGVTEMRGPNYGFLTQNALQDILESHGQFVDGLKFSGGSHSLLSKSFIKEVTDLAHKHDIYVSTGDWAEHLLRQGPSAFKQYVEECKHLGFDTIEINVESLEVPEETLLRFVRLIKSGGLKVKPQFALKVDKSDLPVAGDRAFGAYIFPSPRTSEIVEDVDLLVRRAERCLEAGADMIMIDADDICGYADTLRTDVVAKIIGRLGLEKTMFEASTPRTSEWFVKRYGPRVNLFVDHSQVMNLECLRGRNLASDEQSRQFLNMPEEAIQMVLSQLTDQNLKHTLQFGIGLHHAGLNDKDRSLVEELFANNKIQVLVCTSTLAWGVNLPAHMVIIKGTEYYDGKTKIYVDFPITDILQMMGRAGRPQYDQHGKTVILVHEPKKSFYKKFLYEPFPVESNLRMQCIISPGLICFVD